MVFKWIAYIVSPGVISSTSVSHFPILDEKYMVPTSHITKSAVLLLEIACFVGGLKTHPCSFPQMKSWFNFSPRETALQIL